MSNPAGYDPLKKKGKLWRISKWNWVGAARDRARWSGGVRAAGAVLVGGFSACAGRWTAPSIASRRRPRARNRSGSRSERGGVIE